MQEEERVKDKVTTYIYRMKKSKIKILKSR